MAPLCRSSAPTQFNGLAPVQTAGGMHPGSGASDIRFTC